IEMYEQKTTELINKNTELNNLCSKLQKRNKALKQKRFDLETANTEMQHKVKNLQSSVSQLTAAVQEKEDMLAALRDSEDEIFHKFESQKKLIASLKETINSQQLAIEKNSKQLYNIEGILRTRKFSPLDSYDTRFVYNKSIIIEEKSKCPSKGTAVST